MKKSYLMSLTATIFVANLVVASLAQAQGNRIYRCGNEYTNTVQPGQKGCKLVEGGNVTVVQRPRPVENVRLAATSQAVANLEAERQRQRDADARMILEAELRKAEGPARRSAQGIQQRRAREDGPRVPQPPEVPGPCGRPQGQHRAQRERSLRSAARTRPAAVGGRF